MEKAVLKTLIYADIFDYPLKINEIHKWLVGKKSTLRQVDRTVKKLNLESRIGNFGDYYFLKERKQLVRKRLYRVNQSVIYFKKAKILSQILKIIPWIKLVGISGGLSMENASKKDDIDLFIILGKNRLWISRLFILGLLSLAGQRRTRVGKIAGKLCVNILLEEDKLEQVNKDIFISHEVLQMKVLWQRDGMYSNYLEDNSWAFKFLPNWITNESFKNHKSYIVNHKSPLDYIENLAKWFQLKIMQKPRGLERIEDGALYFHPKDLRQEVLTRYKKRITKLKSIAN
ncbi:hypothetical protein HY383_01635 [Candidatus Daviesbacteria bacterium]|nr:hypothetical protein [Candidatus Daviesbacteria bacterium]